MQDAEVVIVGSGPNGLAAAIRLASAGLSVVVVEARPTAGGGLHDEALTLPGFVHDRCAACMPMAVVSPYLRRLPLASHGLSWASGSVSVAHPLDDRPAALHVPSLDQTADGLGADAARYRRLLGPLVERGLPLFDDLLAPLGIPHDPPGMASFGVRGLWPATTLGAWFRDTPARALLAGCAAHATQPLTNLFTGAVGLVFLLVGHLAAWPVVRGGSGRLAEALGALLRARGGRIVTGWPVDDLRAFSRARAVVCDVDPHQLARIGEGTLPERFRARLRRYRMGPASFKLDWALDGPIPWTDPRVAEAATVHVGGTLEEIAAAEGAVWKGAHPERPYVLVVQQSALDPTRAPPGHQTGYAYVHVPEGSTVDQTDIVERQIERFAPRFRDRILARHVTTPRAFELWNRNFVGGAVTGGPADWRQLFTRPVAQRDPYRTPNPRVFLCSAATPPGGGVHGMGGYHAARSVLRRLGLPVTRGEPEAT